MLVYNAFNDAIKPVEKLLKNYDLKEPCLKIANNNFGHVCLNENFFANKSFAFLELKSFKTNEIEKIEYINSFFNLTFSTSFLLSLLKKHVEKNIHLVFEPLDSAKSEYFWFNSDIGVCIAKIDLILNKKPLWTKNLNNNTLISKKELSIIWSIICLVNNYQKKSPIAKTTAETIAKETLVLMSETFLTFKPNSTQSLIFTGALISLKTFFNNI